VDRIFFPTLYELLVFSNTRSKFLPNPADLLYDVLGTFLADLGTKRASHANLMKRVEVAYRARKNSHDVRELESLIRSFIANPQSFFELDKLKDPIAESSS